MYILFVLVFLITRVYIVTSQPLIFDAYDSEYYFNFVFFNSFRLPVITFLFSSLGDYRYIVIFQALFSGLAWIIFLRLSQKIIVNKYSKFIYQVMIIFFSFSEIVILRDRFILSESLTLASALILTAIVLNFERANITHHVIFIIGLVFFSGIKSTNSVIGFVILVTYIIFVVLTSKDVFKFKITITATLLGTIFILNFLYSSLNSNITSQLNTSAIVNYRIWGNSDWRDYLFEKNFPPELRTIWRDRQNYNIGETPDQGVINEFIYQDWWISDGNDFLITFMKDHPLYTLIGPVFLPLLNSSTDFSHTLIYGWAQDPRANIEIIKFDLPTNLLWPEERLQSYTLVFLMLIFISIYLLMSSLFNKKSSVFLTRRITGVMFYVILWSYFSWWFGSKPGGDILRHQEMPSVVLRLVFLVCVFKMIDLVCIRCERSKFSSLPRY